MCSRLEQAGIRCWIAPRDVRPGRNWGSEIIRGLDNAKVMIVVLSANANDSPPVMNEVERAFHKRIAIIPVRTEDVMPSEALEYFLSPKHWLDAFNPPLEAHIDRLARTVEEYLVEQGWRCEGHRGTFRRAPADCGAAFQRGRGRNSTDGCSEPSLPVGRAGATPRHSRVRAGRRGVHRGSDGENGKERCSPSANATARATYRGSGNRRSGFARENWRCGSWGSISLRSDVRTSAGSIANIKRQ